MAFLNFPNVKIAGIAAGVPKKISSNLDDVKSSVYDAEAYIETTGVRERRTSKTLTTSDLGYEAAEVLIRDLGWCKEEIEALIFVSQTPDYILPATSCILQDRLGLSKDCYCTDISLGCSGWTYGLSSISALVSNGSIKKAILIAGDAKGRYKLENDPAAKDPLFGSASTATAIEYVEGCKGIIFQTGTDGSGYSAIITPDGGSRNPVNFDSFILEDIDGSEKCRMSTRMNGMDVFAFGISVPPKSIKKLSEKFNFDYNEADFILFHQANMKMNKTIIKKLKLDTDKVPSCMYNFGNTSSASIPLTIVTQLKGKADTGIKKFICCGFGVGLSWATAAFETNDLLISDLVEVDELTGEENWI